MARPKGSVVTIWKRPARPPCLGGEQSRWYYDGIWTDDALVVMDKAFCEAVSRAHGRENRGPVW